MAAEFVARHTTVVAMPVTKPTALAHAESLQQRCARPTLSRSRTATGAGYSKDKSGAAAPAASGLGWGRGWDFACCRANSAAGLELRGPGRLSRCDELCVPEVAQLQPLPQRSWPARVGLVSGLEWNAGKSARVTWLGPAKRQPEMMRETGGAPVEMRGQRLQDYLACSSGGPRRAGCVWVPQSAETEVVHNTPAQPAGPPSAAG